MIKVLIKPLLYLMNACYMICGNYGIAIIMFTLLSKIILLPVSIWVQNNSIKMVKMQPEINEIKARFYGDRGKIADEEADLYKKNKYNPFASIIPVLIQLILLMGVIEVIKTVMNRPGINKMFMGMYLNVIPSELGGLYILFPFIAAFSSLIMCLCQNKSNVLQAETNIFNRILSAFISVGLSLYLGFFVSTGVVLYWIFSNIFAIALLYILNYFINPKKYVDYERLEASRIALKKIEDIKISKSYNKAYLKELYVREKTDYKKFFSIVNKHLVFYSESSGFYKYYEGLIKYLLENSKLVIHYITSDPNDNIFEIAKKESRVKAYYIGEKRLITLMMRMDADIVAMTMPDLENYHIKRSYIRKDIEYLYIQHGIGSVNLLLRKGSLDHYDTIFCCGKTQKMEILEMETYYKTKQKKLVECGYFLLDDMINAYNQEDLNHTNEKATILIAPSWQDDNIIDSCLKEILDNLLVENYNIVVRPHPQYVRHNKDKLLLIESQYNDFENVKFQMDFSDTESVLKADLLLTDWSDISTEYAFCTKKPVLFINTPMKIMNEEWEKIDVVPLNIQIRNIFGRNLNLDELNSLSSVVQSLLSNKEDYRIIISDYMEKEIYNLGKSSCIGGEYIIKAIKEKIELKKLSN